MNERHLSSRGFFSFFAMIAVLTLTILACGVGAGAPAPSAEQPGAAMPTESSIAGDTRRVCFDSHSCHP